MKIEITGKKILPFFICLPLLAYSQLNPLKQNPVWPRSVIIPIPDNASGPGIVSLNGIWMVKGGPQDDFKNLETDLTGWIEIQVPGSRNSLKGIPGKIFVYRKIIIIPDSFKGKRTILRFDGVTSAARLWINGTFVREHWGSYMTWTCDISDYIKPGEEAVIALEVNDNDDGLAGEYVFTGGILGAVQMYALPQNYITRFHVETDFDENYKDAVLKIRVAMSFNNGNRSLIKLTLVDPHGNKVRLLNNEVMIDKSKPEGILEIPIAHPLKWDAEHPNLYTLNLSLIAKNDCLESITKKIGFREVKRVGNQLFVNGLEVKLRGIMLGDNYPIMRAANINHTRQKWVTEKLLDECDSIGMYVLDENPVNFVKYGPEKDPRFAYQWLSLISDLVERDFSHPSVIMWGLGNESFHGENVTKTFHFVSEEDPKRPTIFSWSQQVPPEEELPYTIYSHHYPDNNGTDADFTSYGAAIFNFESLIPLRKQNPDLPILFDESAHLPLVNLDEMKHDPNVHNFWGESMKLFWERFFPTRGILGCDVFGLWMEDVQIDKPEYWLVKKAFSPVRIKDEPLANPGKGKTVVIPIKNWFDHTNLNEIIVKWKVGRDSGKLTGPDIQPHKDGILTLPSRDWESGDTLNLKFFRLKDLLVDEYNLPIDPSNPGLPLAADFAPEIKENDREIMISGPSFKIVINKYTGQITEGACMGNVVITGGPHVTLLGASLPLTEWWPTSIKVEKVNNEAVIKIKGGYISFTVALELRIDGLGMITTNYCLETIPDMPPKLKNIPWNNSTIGGYSEVGIAFDLSADVDRLSWKRKGLWSVYPSNHIGRNVGTAIRNPATDNSLMWPVSDTDRRLYGNNDPGGRGTNDFRSSKEYISRATAWISKNHTGLQAVSNEKDAVRLEVLNGKRDGNVRMFINNEWNYPNLGLGNLMKPPLMIRSGYSNTIKVRLVNSIE